MKRSIARPLAAAAFSAAACTAPAATAAAAEGFTPSPLLGDGVRAPRDGGVEVAAWIEPTPDAADVVVTLTPTGRAKLVADPGITVAPAEPDDGVAWRTPVPYELVDADAGYFTEPPTIRLPLGAPEVGPIDLDVEYAYCFVDFQCFFGEEELTVADGGL